MYQVIIFFFNSQKIRDLLKYRQGTKKALALKTKETEDSNSSCLGGLDRTSKSTNVYKCIRPLSLGIQGHSGLMILILIPRIII